MTAAPKSTTTANEITASLLIEIPKRFPHVRVWRQNSGGGIGMSTVKQAVALLRKGKVTEAIRLLTSRPIKWGIEGCADISGIIGPRGQRLELEVKAEGDKQSADQLAFEGMIIRAGGLYLVARSVEECLREMGRWV